MSAPTIFDWALTNLYTVTLTVLASWSVLSLLIERIFLSERPKIQLGPGVSTATPTPLPVPPRPPADQGHLDSGAPSSETSMARVVKEGSINSLPSFIPPAIAAFGGFQTFVASFTRSVPWAGIEYVSSDLRLPRDAPQVRPAAKMVQVVNTGLSETAPVMLIVPTLGGAAIHPAPWDLITAATQGGFRVIVLELPGAPEVPLLTPSILEPFHSAEWIALATDYLDTMWPQADSRVAVGIGAGCLVLQNWLNTSKDATPDAPPPPGASKRDAWRWRRTPALDSMILVSSWGSLGSWVKALNRWSLTSIIASRFWALLLRVLSWRSGRMLKDIGVDYHDIKAAKSVPGWFKSIGLKLANAQATTRKDPRVPESVDDVYSSGDLGDALKTTVMPTVVISARDDPCLRSADLDAALEAGAKNPWVVGITTRRGGSAAWQRGPIFPLLGRSWMTNAVVSVASGLITIARGTRPRFDGRDQDLYESNHNEFEHQGYISTSSDDGGDDSSDSRSHDNESNGKGSGSSTRRRNNNLQKGQGDD